MSYELRDNRRSSYMAKGRANTPIDVIVIHHWGLDGQHWENLTSYTANNRNMSTHYVAMAGKVERQVDEEDTAYHGGNPPINQRSIGIECRPEATDEDYDTVSELVADIWSRHGKLPLIGHNRVPSVMADNHRSKVRTDLWLIHGLWLSRVWGSYTRCPE